MNKHDKKLYRNPDEPVMGNPETCDEILHKFGTYNIQPTAESDNSFPKISHGLPTGRKEKNYKGFDNKKRES